MMKFEIGYYEDAENGRKFHAVRSIKRATDSEAEAEIDSLKNETPPDESGASRHGLYIKRGGVKWFRRFSVHA